jgi:hypothetical protein
MERVVLYGTKRNGKIEWSKKEMTAGFIDALPEGKTVELVMRRYYPQRSDEQNRYWWGVVVHLIAERTGFPKDDVHELLMAKFTSQEAVVEGAKTRIRKSSTELNTQEFTDLIEQTIAWAAEKLDLVIPTPEEPYAI